MMNKNIHKKTLVSKGSVMIRESLPVLPRQKEIEVTISVEIQEDYNLDSMPNLIPDHILQEEVKKYYTLQYSILDSDGNKIQTSECLIDLKRQILVSQRVLDEFTINDNLHQAIKNGNIDEAKSLIEKGANVNAMDKDGYTPLHLASINGHTEVVKYLFENGANVNAKNSNGNTPLHYASMNGYKEVVELLLKNGATKTDLNDVTENE